MAALTADQVKPQWVDTGARRWTLFAMLNVTSGDTADLSAYFRVIKQTAWMGATVSGVVAGTFTAQGVTAPAGLSADSAYLLVDGVPV